MSASREKKLRQAASDTPKTARELEKEKAEKRSNFLYRAIALVFVVLAVVSLIWKSNIIARSATAVTVDGTSYNAAEVNFYYQNAYRAFLSENSYFISYLGLDTNSSLKGQTVNATAASMLGVEEGSSWHEYILDVALDQLTTVQRGLAKAEAEGYVYPAGVEAQYEDSMAALHASAESSGLSVKEYLQRNLGSTMTEKVYGEQMRNMVKYQYYFNAYSDSLNYTDGELESAYQADPRSYDKISWEYVTISSVAESTTDEAGNTVAASDEENAKAKEAAKETADKILAAYRSGTSLEEAAKAYEGASYYHPQATNYYDSVTGNWLFDDARKSGDAEVLELQRNYYVSVFHERYRDESDTVDVRHILVMPEAGTLTSGEEGYEAEQTELKAAARAKAEDILAQWKAGEASEDSFIILAMRESADGSKYTGGLIADVGPDSSLVDEFKDWCLDPARKDGDTAVVDSTYGSHVMYFSGRDLPAWASAVRANLRNETFNTWLDELTANATVEQGGFGMRFVG